MKTSFLLLAALMSSLFAASARTIFCDDPKLVFAPYVWLQSGSGVSARAEATIPGAYLKAAFTGSRTVGIIIDATGNAGGDPNTRPSVEWSVDYGPFQTELIDRNAGVYTLPLAHDLAPDKPHRFEFYFKSANLSEHRWTASTAHLRPAGLALDDGGSLVDCPRRGKLAIAYGDSITEGVGVEGLFSTWQSIGMNNALKTWVPLLASSLDCEYGQVGSGGFGMVKPIELPPLTQTWDSYDKGHSRLQGGLLLPEPDYVFCNLGTNDSGFDITAGYLQWLADMRKACPHSRFFCIVPLMGLHRGEISAAVSARRSAGDARVYLIDLAALEPGFHYTPAGTVFAYEGVHPSAYGQALFAAHLAVEVQKILDSSP